MVAAVVTAAVAGRCAAPGAASVRVASSVIVGSHFDSLETRDPEERERSQLDALPAQIAFAKTCAPAYAKLLADVDAAAIDSLDALARLPVVRKSELLELQKADRPFGGFAVPGWRDAALVFASPGPIYEPEGGDADYWRLARALHAAGFRGGDLVHNCFSYHFTPGGAMLESGARALGCAVFRGGTGQTEQQVEAMVDLRPDGYVGTPSFLRIILDKMDERRLSVPSLTRTLLSGEAVPQTLRDVLRDRGIGAHQVYASADVGSIAYETDAHDGLVVDEGVLLEIVRAGTGDIVAPGEVGEVVVTLLHNRAYPMIRFGTGDLSAIVPASLSAPSACGRTNLRIKGWLGRADQTTKVKGMFVHPSQVALIASRHPEIAKARLVVDNFDGGDVMTLHVEVAGGDESARDAIIASIRDVTKLRGEVKVHAPGSLANDGKVIDDIRRYD